MLNGAHIHGNMSNADWGPGREPGPTRLLSRNTNIEVRLVT